MAPDRRDALKLLAAAAALPACQGQGQGQGGVASEAAVLAVAPLEQPWQTPDPFLFCVHHDDRYPVGNARLGPAASLAGRELGRDFAGLDGWRMYHGTIVPGFPQHPHRGFETVTVVRRGMLDHSDSLGATARYGRGDVQWLTAGRGIQHAEVFPLRGERGPNPVGLFQIWLNLPRADKLAAPHFSMLWDHTVPRVVARDEDGRATEVTVVAGQLGARAPGAPPPSSWAARADSDVAIWTIRMAPGARWTLPAARRGSNRSLYFFRGDGLRLDGRPIPAASAVELRGDAAVALAAGAGEETELLLLQGRPIGEPVVKHGPFVMTTRDEIRETIRDYQATGFGTWSWASAEPVHARDAGRFARFADGRIERPA